MLNYDFFFSNDCFMVFLDIKIVNISTITPICVWNFYPEIHEINNFSRKLYSISKCAVVFFGRNKNEDFLTLRLLTHVQYGHSGPDIPDVQK